MKQRIKIHSQNISLDKTLGSVLIVIVAIWLLMGVRRMWTADLAYTAGRSNLTENLNAVKLNPREPLYYAQLGNVQALVAVQIIAPKIETMTASTSANLKQQANAYLQQLISDAVINTSKAVSMNKYNLNLLKSLQDEFGFKMLFVTHDMNSAKILCEDICVIKDGRVVESGKMEDILKKPSAQYTKILIDANFANRKFRI